MDLSVQFLKFLDMCVHLVTFWMGPETKTTRQKTAASGKQIKELTAKSAQLKTDIEETEKDRKRNTNETK